MTSEILRKKFIEFFIERGHKEVPAASLVPENDPSVLFTTAGMQQFKRYYTEPDKAPVKNIVNIQPCFRTSDIEEVGDESHLTFFEMLGNFSFGGYEKAEAIKYAWNFLIEALKINKNRISATYYDGSKASGPTGMMFEETDKIARKELKIYLDDSKIKPQGNDNFWTLGTFGSPGGRTVEFYVDGLEIWNIVFNEAVRKRDPHPHWHWFKTDSSGEYSLGIDTGMGLERLLAIMQNKDDIYETELFQPIIETCEENIDGEVKYENNKRAFRIIADHIRAVVFLLADGIMPGNIEQGYVLRRLIRRIIRYWRLIGGEGPILSELASAVIENYKDTYLQLSQNENRIISELQKEENKFNQALDKGLKEFEKMVSNSQLSGAEAFRLYESYGFPFEMTKELAKEKNIKIDENEFKKALKKHQEKSRAAAKGKFKSGLVGENEKTIQYHTATHLLLAALKKFLGEHIHQKGSNITEERLRFDFSHPQKLTEEERQKVEDLVNEKIAEGLPVICEEMTVEEAKAKGAEAQFTDKYGDKVKVYTIGEFSSEICGGPHVKNTSDLGKFKITNEQSSSAGVRRIKAILL